MSLYLAAEEEFYAGEIRIVEAPARSGPYVVVFEDDENTGYLYALNMQSQGNPIQSAVHIYNVNDVSDRARLCTMKIGWSKDHAKAVLLINDRPHAVIDFAAKTTSSRSGFAAQVSSDWSAGAHDWDDVALKSFD